MDSMEENICNPLYTCRLCNGTGNKYYYYPVNKRGDCPHCGGLKKLDWVTNIKGVHWKVRIPSRSEGDDHTIRLYEKLCSKYGKEKIDNVVSKRTFWRFVFEDDIRERKEKIKNWENESYARVLATSNTITAGI